MAFKLFSQFQLVLFVIINGLAISASAGKRSIQTFTPTTQPPPHATVHGLDSTNQASSGQDDKVSDLANVMIKGFADLGKENGGRDNSQKNSDSDYLDDDLFNCSLPATADRYCVEMPKQVREYFKNDLSVSGLLSSIFKKEIVENLQFSCPSLSWCLADSIHQLLMQGKAAFYSSSPICSDGMWVCLETILEERIGCDDKQMRFLMSATDLLCSIEEVGKLPVDEECYARILEALYAIYADLTNTAGSQATQLEQAGCTSSKVQMTKAYLCAYDVCNASQRSLLQTFDYWKGTAAAANETATSCNIPHTCKPRNTVVDYGSTATSTPGTYNVDYEGLEKILEQIEKETEDAFNSEGSANESATDDSASNEVNEDAIGTANGEDTAFMFGIIAMTTVFLVGLLGLAFLGYRRFCRAGYDKRGYSKLMDEEAKLLRTEYS